MKFNNSNNNDSTVYEVPAKKTYPGRLVGIYDIGVQPGNPAFKNEKGEPDKDKPQVVFIYELLGKDKQSDGTNFQVSEFLTVSMHVKGKLAKRMAVFGAPVKKKNDDWYEIAEDYVLTAMLGEPCMITIDHTAAGKAKVADVIAPVEGMQIAEPTIKLGFLDLDTDDYLDYFTKAPKWIQAQCQKSIGWLDR